MNFDLILFILWTSRRMPFCVVLDAVGEDAEVEKKSCYFDNINTTIQLTTLLYNGIFVPWHFRNLTFFKKIIFFKELFLVLTFLVNHV